MSKLIKVIALIVIAAVIVIAAPFVGAIAATTFGISIGAAAAIASALVTIGLTLGATALLSLFRSTPKGLSQSLTDRLNGSVNPTAPRRIVFGTTAAAADIRFFETYGSKSDSYVQVYALASHKLSAITSFYAEADLTWSANGSTVSADKTIPGTIVHNSGGFNSIRAVPLGVAGSGFALGSHTYWQASASFTGCAYLVVDWKLDSKIWPRGIPSKITTIVNGCPLYDPRLDSTVGGSGSHRVADQTTWQFTAPNGVVIGRNPALALLTYMIGWRINGKLAWGMGIPATSINFANWAIYANVCEESVQTAAGGTVQRYTADAMFSTADTHETVIATLSAAMGSAKMTDIGGQYQLAAGYDDTLGPVPDFDESDLAGGAGAPAPYIWSPAGAAKDTYNSVTGRFADPAQLYQLSTWGEIDTATLADGVPRPLTLDLGAVDRPETCQRIAKQILLANALTPGTFTATFGARAFQVQVGSLMTLTLGPQGWNRKLFRVINQKEVHDMFYQMILKEESSGVYAWDREEKPLPASIRPTGYDPTTTIAPAGMTLSVLTYQST